MKLRLAFFTLILLAIGSITAISLAQRPQADKPIAGDFKITFKQSLGQGQEMTSTTMIKGRRERSEMSMPGMPAGMGMTTITECDLRRTIQINDRARKYMITPMDSDDAEAPATPTGPRPSAGPSRRGGVVTFAINTVDTGERKDMFGFTARHLKQTMMSETSPDACQQNNMKIERDGWYINLEYGLNCGSERPPQAPNRMPTGGCRDTYRFKHTGVTNLGYPLIETTKMFGPDGQTVTFTMTKEVIELSRQPLDAALFDVPAGYTQANSQQEMYSMSMSDAMAMAQEKQGGDAASHMPSNTGLASSSSSMAVRPKIGVVEFNNKAKATVSTDELRQQLIATLTGDGIEAVALNASSASEAAMEAKAKGCTYILYTDISTFKAPSTGKKIGGLLGRATGATSGDAGKSEAKFDFRLVPAAGGSPKLQSSASGKEDTTDASVRAAVQEEARAVIGAIGG
ncbi:MAG TPA: hypothetical protein VE961_01960 [Pyrinomonadaceae bacterium]|nr:hypothetical protein [Pyrinomonadaceae bacterium]